MKKINSAVIINVAFVIISCVVMLLIVTNLQVIIEDFYENILISGAYIGLWKGLKVTLFLTLVGVLLGSIFGALFCGLRMAKIKGLQITGQILIEVLRGTPVVMLLMLLYFFAFRDTRVDALYVAMLGFGLNTGSHMAEIFRTSIEAINLKEIEAARMLGFSKVKAFFFITLPQSWNIARPVYQSSIISLLQWTTVAGYISVTELTRIINGLGSRTGNPFYALFIGIVIYLLIAYIVKAFFWIGDKRREAR